MDQEIGTGEVIDPRLVTAIEALAAELGVAPADLWLVSCHAFDTLGAAAAGYRTALVPRPENVPVSLGRMPDIVAGDLHAVTERIIASAARPRHG